jgi:hypothetical protein
MPVTSFSSAGGGRERLTYESRAATALNSTLLYQTFLASLEKISRTNEQRFHLELYAAIDEGDPLYDNRPRWEALRTMVARLMAPKQVPLTLHDPIVLPLLRGNNAYLWNHALAAAYIDGCDYLYQASDDNHLMTDDFFAHLLDMLRTCRSWGSPPRRVRNLGIACPKDKFDLGLCYQGLVHRSLYEAWAFFFNPIFANFSADDFVTKVFADLGLRWGSNDLLSWNTDSLGKRYEWCRPDMGRTVSDAKATYLDWFSKARDRTDIACTEGNET